MIEHRPGAPALPETDLEFVVGQAAPDARDGERLKRLIREDEELRGALVGDERVFQTVMDDEEIFVRISPALYFEVLLRRALRDLESATHTVERAGRQAIPVFDTADVVELLGRPGMLLYLAQMLASFTRIESYVTPVRVRRGIRRRVRYNDMDIDSLQRFCAAADEDQRFSFYKRIADVCLFVSSVFPDHALGDRRYPSSGQSGPAWSRRRRRSHEEYEIEGRRFYRLAEEHPTAQVLELSGVFGLLRDCFASARKPLTFIASQYLHSRKHHLFGVQAP